MLPKPVANDEKTGSLLWHIMLCSNQNHWLMYCVTPALQFPIGSLQLLASIDINETGHILD